MFKVDLPPDSSWKWKMKTFDEPLPTGRYVLTEDYNKLQKEIIRLQEAEASAMALCMNQDGSIDRLMKRISEFEKEITKIQESETSAKELCANYENQIEHLTKSLGQAVEFLSMKMEDLTKEGKNILDFQAVWIRQARDGIQKLQYEILILREKLSACEKIKQAQYNEILNVEKTVKSAYKYLEGN